jgi:hypothetical protein
MQVARFLCVTRGGTISLLPGFLAARVTGTLDAVEEAVAVAEGAPTRAAAAETLRPDDEDNAVTTISARRWLMRRVRWVGGVLATLTTLLPQLMGTAPTVAAVRARLGTTSALVALRALAAEHLGALPAPVGLAPRGRR